jgi:hypothetical protein
MKTIFLFSIILLSFSANSQSRYKYSTVYIDSLNDNKGGWTITNDWKTKINIQNGVLSHYYCESGFLSKNLSSIALSDTIKSNKVLSFKMANMNNINGLEYFEYKKQENGDIKKLLKTVSHPIIGFTWGYKDWDNHHAIYFKTIEDLGASRTYYKIVSVIKGEEIIHKNWTYNSNLSEGTGYNEVHLEFKEGYCSVYFGYYHNSFAPNTSFEISDWFTTNIGVIVSSPAKVFLDYVKLERMDIIPPKIDYGISYADINEAVNIFSNSMKDQTFLFYIKTRMDGTRIFKIDYEAIEGLPNDEEVLCKEIAIQVLELFFQQINYNREKGIPMNALIEIFKEKEINGFEIQTKNRIHDFSWSDLKF